MYQIVAVVLLLLTVRFTLKGISLLLFFRTQCNLSSCDACNALLFFICWNFSITIQAGPSSKSTNVSRMFLLNAYLCIYTACGSGACYGYVAKREVEP